MSAFETTPTPIAGVLSIRRKPRGDERGYLERMFCQNDLAAVVGTISVAQINHTVTRQRGVVRGMHFQRVPRAEMKFVSCLRGEVFDVAVDLREGSKTFLQWHAERLCPEQHNTLVIPPGCAHGFQTLTDDCELIYLHTEFYTPEAEGGVNAVDPRLAIGWPLPVHGRSPRDEGHPFIDSSFRGLS